MKEGKDIQGRSKQGPPKGPGWGRESAAGGVTLWKGGCNLCGGALPPGLAGPSLAREGQS